VKQNRLAPCALRGAIAILAAAALLSAAKAKAAPAVPTLVAGEGVVGYVKYASPAALSAKVQGYGQQVMPGKVPPDVLRPLFPGSGSWDTPEVLKAVDPAKCWTAFMLIDAGKFSWVGYVPLKAGSDSTLKGIPTMAVKADHLLVSSNPAALTKAEALDGEFRSINEEAPMADVRACLNMAPLESKIKETGPQLKALAGQAGLEAMNPFDRAAELGAVSLDIQLAREGAEFQLNAFPRAGTELAKLCDQPPAGAFPLAAFLPGAGAIRAIWRVQIPSQAAVYEPEGAMELMFPGKGPMSQAQIIKMKDVEKGSKQWVDEMTKQLSALGAKFEEAYTPNVRQSGGVSISKIDCAAALKKAMPAAKGPAPPAFNMAQMFAPPPVELAMTGNYILTAMGSEQMDAMIGKIQSNAVQAEPLAAQKVYPGTAQAYADIDLVKILQCMEPFLGMAAMAAGPPVKALDYSALKNLSAPPLCAMAEFSTGAVSFKLYIPLETAKAIASVGGNVAAANFEEADTRAKVSRAQSDMRSLATAIEAYFVDNNAYPAFTLNPKESIFPLQSGGKPVPTFRASPDPKKSLTLTTPIAYIARYPPDPFGQGKEQTYGYFSIEPPGWILFSPGPDGAYDGVWEVYDPLVPQPSAPLLAKAYDPTNGTVSGGDVFRCKQ